MRLINRIVFFVCIVLFTSSCTDERNKQNVNIETEIKDSVVTNMVYFQDTLALQNIYFTIKVTRVGERSQIVIQPEGLEVKNAQLIVETNDEVIGAEIEDLNSDNFPELFIYTVSNDSNRIGNVIAYSVNDGKSVSEITFPNQSENKEAFEGYMGYDEFAVVETSLIRRFPVQKDTSHVTRQIQYKLIDGESSRKLVIKNIWNYNKLK